MRDNVKICQLCTVDFTLRTLLLPLVDGMIQQGWNVTSVCSDGKWVEQMQNDGYQIVTVPMSRHVTDVRTHLVTIYKLYRLFRKNKFDVLHVHSPIAALLGRVAGKLARVPLIIYTAHGFHFHDEMKNRQYRLFVFLERMAGKLTDFIFTQSMEDKYAAINNRIVPQERVETIGNGVNPMEFEPIELAEKKCVRQELGISEKAVVIGIVCRMVREKGLVEFLEAAMILSESYPDAHFLFVGERLSSERDQPFDDEWNTAQKKLGSRLIATGYRADISSMLGAMDVFCLPSYREGMPRSIIEAMMMGLPVVATDIRGSREEVIHDKTGVLVKVRDVGSLSEALEKLLVDSQLRERMGSAGRERALKLYDENKVIDLELSIIRKLISDKHGC